MILHYMKLNDEILPNSSKANSKLKQGSYLIIYYDFTQKKPLLCTARTLLKTLHKARVHKLAKLSIEENKHLYKNKYNFILSNIEIKRKKETKSISNQTHFNISSNSYCFLKRKKKDSSLKYHLINFQVVNISTEQFNLAFKIANNNHLLLNTNPKGCKQNASRVTPGYLYPGIHKKFIFY